MPRWSPLLIVVTALLSLGSPGVALPLLGQTAHDAVALTGADRPAWLGDTRTETQRDQVHAAALAALGRLHFQRQEYLAALRRYQRAWRYNPNLMEPLRDIVPLAFTLDRGAEATRYAVVAAELAATEPRLLKQLGDFLAARGDLERAEGFYERAWRCTDPAETDQQLVLADKLGRLRFLTGDFCGAAAAFERLLPLLDRAASGESSGGRAEELLKAGAQTFTLIAESFLQAGKPNRAEVLFRRAAQAASPPSPPRLALQLSRVAVQRKDWSAARRHWEDYWKEPPATQGNEPYELLRELLAHETGDQAAAREQTLARLERRLEKDPGNAALADFVARLHLEGGRPERALEIYQQAAERDRREGTLAGLARVALQQDKPGIALSALGQLFASHGTLRPVAGALRKLGQDPARQSALVDLAVRRGQAGRLSSSEAIAGGLIAVQADRCDQAERLFEITLDAETPAAADIYNLWTASLLAVGQYDRAAAVLRAGLQRGALARRAAATYFLMSRALALAGRTEDAVRAARRAAALKADAAEFASQVGWVHYRAEQDEEAEAAYRAVIERWDDSNDEATRETLRETRRVLSNICLRQERVEESVEWLEQVLDEFPEDPGALNDLGYLWADRNLHLERSLRMIQQAVAAEPENPSFRDSLAWAYHRLGRHEEALREAIQAASGENSDGVILDHLGDIHWELGHRDEAFAAWRRAVRAFQRDREDPLGQAVQAKLQRHEAPDR